MSNKLCGCSPDCMIPYGHCHCGCNGLAPISNKNDKRFGWAKGKPKQFIRFHSNNLEYKLESPNPSGYCMCGCGEVTPIAKATSISEGRVRGKHNRYISGHNPVEYTLQESKDVLDRYKEQDGVLNTPCWIWTSSLDKHGYGVTQINGKQKRAHRVFYEHHIGKIGSDPLHHLCENKPCVNPRHLKPIAADLHTALHYQYGHGKKINIEIAREIRELCSKGMFQKDVARIYGVTQPTVSAVVLQKIWSESNYVQGD